MQGELILCLSTISWDFLWQRHQELMARFAREGNSVIYIEPIGIRVPKWEDRARILSRLRNRQSAGRIGLRARLPNLWIYDPILLPFQSRHWVHALNLVLLRNRLGALCAERGSSTPIIWTYVPTRLAVDALSQLHHKLLIYDCVDALVLNPKGVFSSYRASEIKLSQMADLVFVTSQQLFRRQQPLNPHTYLVPNGVDLDCFSQVSLPTPADLSAVPSPRIGFFGGIDERLDLELLDHLAANYPTWSLVMLGVVRTDVSRLKSRRNVFFLGLKAHCDLPAYLKNLDVLILPYLLNDYTVHMYPAKIHECLAVGKPTIATALPELEEFRQVMYVCSSPQSFEQAIQTALREERDSALVRSRRAVAEANTWSNRFAVINQKMDERCRTLNPAA